MRVGDLVKYVNSPELGLVIDFDKDGDPVVQFCTDRMKSAAYLMADIEVVNDVG
jgi:hypothetical protein